MMGDDLTFGYEFILSRARKFGAHPCSWEAAVAARLNILDQKVGDSFMIVTDGSQNNPDKDHRFPFLGNGKPTRGNWIGNPFAGLFISTSRSSGKDRSPDHQFVFCRPS